MTQEGGRPRPVEGISGSDLQDEYLIYNQQGDKIHVLNGTAREIFLLCDGSRTAGEIAREIAGRYDGVDEATARHDTDALVRDLVALKILTL